MTVLVLTLIATPLVIFLLAAPIILCVDTETDNYCIRLGDLCSLRAIAAMENPGIRLRIGFWKKRWTAGELLSRSISREREEKTAKEKAARARSKMSIKRMWRVLRTFKVSKCEIDLDTNDYVLNAQLYPLFEFCNNRWGRWHMNFTGACMVKLEVESRLIRVLYALLRKT